MPSAPVVVCVGLATLDIVYAVDHVPAADEKLTASRFAVSAGGPATNAAVTAAHLGSRARLITSIGRHPLTGGMVADLQAAHVELFDASPDGTFPPAVSTIMVTAATGERAVVSRNAEGRVVDVSPSLGAVPSDATALLVDGHLPELAVAALKAARHAGAVTLLDAGSWKPVTPQLLPLLDVVIASADFAPPGVPDSEVPGFLLDHGVRFTAVTNGSGPVRWASRSAEGTVPVPAVEVVDTLGAGDVFHGAVLHELAGGPRLDDAWFVRSLQVAAAVAARSCESFGTRAWLGRSPAG